MEEQDKIQEDYFEGNEEIRDFTLNKSTKLIQENGDDEDNVKDNWDDESDDEEKKEPAGGLGVSQPAAPKPVKKSAKDKIAEKEAEKKRQQDALRSQLLEATKIMTPEEAAVQRRRIQKEQEDADFEFSKDTFLSSDPAPGSSSGVIDAFEPNSPETFDQFRTLLVQKITKYQKSEYYAGFLENFFSKLCVDSGSLSAEDLRRFGSNLTTLASEKAKHEKDKAGKGKAKPKKGKPGIAVAKKDDTMATYDYDEIDDIF